jgi:hypothetical protein
MTDLEELLYDGHATQEILRLAGESRKRLDFLSHDDLVRAAAEMDVPEEAISQAEQLVRERQSEADDRAEFRRAKIRETCMHIAIGVPVLSVVLLGHSFAMFNQVFSMLKGMMKGLSGIFFAKSTGHELEFQGWRNKRFYLAEYGSVDPAVIVSRYPWSDQREAFKNVFDWLVESNGIDAPAAVLAIQAYARKTPGKIGPPENGGKGYPVVTPKSFWNTDIAELIHGGGRVRKLPEGFASPVYEDAKKDAEFHVSEPMGSPRRPS